MSHCSVIGASGFLGKAIVDKLVSLGHIVECVFNNHIPVINKSATACIYIEDFLSGFSKTDFIFFAAGSFSNTHQQMISINCELLKKISDKYPNAKLIFISSVSVYGVHKTVITENSSYQLPTIYGLAKLAGEFIALAHKKYAIIRLTYIYGKGLNNNSFIPNIIKQAVGEKKIILYGNGEREQDYLHVDDAANLCIKTMDCNNGIFLGATGVSYSNLQIAEVVSSLVPDCIIEFTGVESGTSFYFDPSFTMEKSRWSPDAIIEDKIAEMLA